MDEIESCCTSSPGFWAGYARWLQHHRHGLCLAVLVLLAVFLGLLWSSGAPPDAFDYAIF